MTDLIVDDAIEEPSAAARRGLGLGSSLGRGEERPARRTSSIERLSRREPFTPAVLAVRWATTGVSVALAIPELLDVRPLTIGCAILLLATTVYRTFRPLSDTGSARNTMALFAETALHILTVITSDYWDSPFVLVLLTSVVVAGFARGFSYAGQVTAFTILAVSIPGLSAHDWTGDELALAAQWSTLLILGGVVAAYTRRISGEARRRHNMALDRVARLADANALLADLHRVAQTLPASLDLEDVTNSSLSRLSNLVGYDAAFILTRESAGSRWSVTAQSALGISGDLATGQLPGHVLRAISTCKLTRAEQIEASDNPFTDSSASGIYVPLMARGRLIGLLGIESRSPAAFSDRDARVLRGFVEPVALAIDNARWFGRIRTIGADEERTRIARDLHDRIGQSLAHLGFEIDRMMRQERAGEPVTESLQQVRTDLRGVVVEVRDTLSDLRTNVTDSKDFAQTAREFAERISERSGLVVKLDCDTDFRLPILQEREMWRVAQEALVNVERHAEAQNISLRWRCDGIAARLEVSDDGKGLPARSPDGQLGRPDSFGIIGMRERADSVGATLKLSSKPGEGTKVTCYLAQT